MALTAAQRTQLFKIFGMPESGTAWVILPPSAPYAARPVKLDYSVATDTFNALLSGLSASAEAEVVALLAQWAAITDYSELKVNADGGSAGRLVDYDCQRAKIKDTLGNIIGFQICDGGGISGRLIR